MPCSLSRFPHTMSQRAAKQKIFALLSSSDLHGAIAQIRALPKGPTLKALFSGLCANDETLRWHAISAMGQVVADIADREMEEARIIMRRFMWGLNDESGGIGWGVPEAMAECLVHHEDLAQEYAHILVSFMREDGFYLEYEPLQRGLMWGVGRLAQVRPELLLEKKAVQYLLPYLQSKDASVRGLAAWALGNLKAEKAKGQLTALTASTSPVRLYQQGTITETTEGALASQVLSQFAARH